MKSPRALVAAVDLGVRKRPLDPELAEFCALIQAAGATIVGQVVQRRDSVDPATLFGAGKVTEICELAKSLDAELLFVFNDLRPRQRKNLAAAQPLPIVDRTMLILDVFAQHARSREGKLQVELAQLRYRQSNLIGMGAELSRLGGGIGTRGPGETKLEVDRRRISGRVSVLTKALGELQTQRANRRQSQGSDPLVALVGYTNVGKSSLLNALAKSDALVADRPFATLDPTVRRVYLSPQHYIRLADTVGFITDLPSELINAFKATLEELQEASVLVHVIDASNADWPRQRTSVETILQDLSLTQPRITVFNKIDAAEVNQIDVSDAIGVSARVGTGLAELRKKIQEMLP